MLSFTSRNLPWSFYEKNFLSRLCFPILLPWTGQRSVFFPESNFFFSFSNIKNSFSPSFLLYFLFTFVFSFHTIVYIHLPLNIPQLYFWLLGVLLWLDFDDFNKTQVTDFKWSANFFFLLSKSFINIIFLQSRKYDIEKKIQLTIQTFLYCLTYFGAIIGTIFCKIKQPKDIWYVLGYRNVQFWETTMCKTKCLNI